MTFNVSHVGFVSALAVGASLLAMPMFAHSDDGDAQLYQVVVRHMIEDGTWTDLRYEPNVHPHYREHLPFGLWPYRAAVQLFGEGALTPMGFLFGLAVLLVTGLLARALYGDAAGIGAVLVLGLTESFFDIAGRARLDGPLMLFALLAAWPVLTNKRVWLALPFAIVAVLIKGPFGLVPLVAAAFVNPIALPIAALATLPALAWLHSDPSWWNGYVVDQLLASATGARTDGDTSFYLPFRVVLGRFWPGLPFVFLARKRALWPLLMLVMLCLPTRKLWFHSLVAFPGLAIAAGAVAARWIEKRERWVAIAAVACWLAQLCGATQLIGKKPYVFCSFEKRPAGTPVTVISSWPWHAISSFAAERRYVVTRADHLEGSLALVSDDTPVDTTGWTRVEQAQGWSFYERR